MRALSPNLFMFDVLLMAFSCITFGIAYGYLQQLRRAPHYSETDLKVNDTHAFLTYASPPIVTFAASIAEVVSMAYLPKPFREEAFVVAAKSVFMAGWSIIAVIWNKCEMQSLHAREDEWPSVCYQSNIKISNGYMIGVSSALGISTMLCADVMCSIFLFYLLNLMVRRGEEAGDAAAAEVELERLVARQAALDLYR